MAQMGFKSKEFGGAGYNQLVFDDSDGQLRTQVASTYAASQLNLGHLIHQADNYRGSFRGEGFELRTDADLAIRGGSGVLLSTYHDGGSAPAGENAALMSLAGQSVELYAALNASALAHQSPGLNHAVGTIGKQKSLLDEALPPGEALRRSLSGTTDTESLEQAKADAAAREIETGAGRVPHMNDALVALAAKGGLWARAQEHLQWSVGEVAAWSTRASAYLVSAGQTRWQAGQAIGITAGAEKPEEGHAALHVTAARDDIEVEAQHDVLRLVSKDALKLRSVEETFEAAAKKRIRIATKAGASITLEDGNIFVECPGKLTIWRMQNDFNGPVETPYELEEYPFCLECWLRASQERKAMMPDIM
jgi:uncharacterized protein (DUF2345 family)